MLPLMLPLRGGLLLFNGNQRGYWIQGTQKQNKNLCFVFFLFDVKFEISLPSPTQIYNQLSK